MSKSHRQDRPHREWEERLKGQGCPLVAGVDEAGRGALAGPVVVSAVILRSDCQLEGLRDSKELTSRQRELLYNEILRQMIASTTTFVAPSIIDEINILQATHLAMRKAIAELQPTPDHVLIDGNPIGATEFPYTAIIDGDAISLSIAAASVLAKVTRDRFMIELHEQFPNYGFNQHKGYGSSLHLQRLETFGPCPHHRKSFAPVRRLLESNLFEESPWSK